MPGLVHPWRRPGREAADAEAWGDRRRRALGALREAKQPGAAAAESSVDAEADASRSRSRRGEGVTVVVGGGAIACRVGGKRNTQWQSLRLAPCCARQPPSHVVPSGRRRDQTGGATALGALYMAALVQRHTAPGTALSRSPALASRSPLASRGALTHHDTGHTLQVAVAVEAGGRGRRLRHF